MKTYCSWWRAAVLVVTGMAVVGGSATRSPWLFVAEGVALGALGAAFGAAWEMDARNRGRVARAWAVRCAVSAVVLVGLPSVIGSWTLLVLGGLGLLDPYVVLAAHRRWAGRRDRPSGPVQGLSDEQLTQRWAYTATAVRSTWRSPAERLRLLEERQRILDEIERRDPTGFAQWLGDSAWRQPQE